MNKAAVVPLALCAAASLFAQPALVAHASMTCSAGCTALMTTPPLDTTKASFIVLAGSDGGSQGIAFRDSQNNAWKPLMRHGTTPGVQFLYCEPCLTSASHTFSNTNGTYPGFAIAAFSGTEPMNVFDVQSGVANANSPMQTGAITTSQPGELLLTAIADQSITPNSVDSMFNLIEQKFYSPGNGYGISLAWKVQPTTSMINPTWRASFGSATIAAFKAAPRIPGGGPIASGTVALSTAVIPPRASDGSGGCSPLVPISAPGAKTLLYTPVPDMTTVAGYAPSSTDSSLYIIPVIGSTQGFRVCSNSANPITPGALSLNWAAF